MSILIALTGLVIAVLFAAAGYRATNDVRHQKFRDGITYQGRVHALYDTVRGANVLSVASFLKRAVVARSMRATSHC